MSTSFHAAEVDGIPTLFAYRRGPMRAGLVFRVGVADETLAGTGITHLTEHLALHRQGLADYHFNGVTKATFTHFLVQGGEYEIVDYLNGVCASLLDLPTDRMEVEKEILRTEAANRTRSQLPLWRYGARGHGLVSYPEWGLHGLRAEDVRMWADTWFTRDNAVLWISGDHFPAGLSLKLLEGARRPLPRVPSALPTTPAFFSDGTGGVLADSVVTEGITAEVYASVLERELFRALRQEGGWSYTAATDLAARGDGFAVLTAFADALPKKQDAVLGGFLDVLAKMQVGRIQQADLDAARGRLDASLTAPDAAAKRLAGAAENLLTGRPIVDLGHLRAELWALTPAHLHHLAAEAAATALLQVPSGHSADWAGYTHAPTESEHAVNGRSFPALAQDGTAVVIGPEGVSLTAAETTITVRYRDCAARLSWPDGGRRLIGTDGITVEVEPSLYGIDAPTMAGIDAAIHPSATVWLPPRQNPPQPAPGAARPASTQAAQPRTTMTTTRTGAQTAALVIFGLLAVPWSGLALIISIFGATDPQTSTGTWIAMTVFFWLVAALLAWPPIRILRRTRRR